MKIATWNVNSLRARLPRVLPWLESRKPDVVCLQETKCVDELFPREEIEELGYNVEANRQKTYNGVAILAKNRIDDVIRGFPGADGAADDADSDEELRVTGATVDDVMILNVYVVNGKQVGSKKYLHKLEWLERLRASIEAHNDMTEKVVLTGDFKITVDNRDVYDPETWREKILCSVPEREELAQIRDLGFGYALRCFHEEPGIYTWWDFRSGGFRRGQGMRIDHFLMSPPALDACTGVEVDLEERTGQKPSDHAPVVATLE